MEINRIKISDDLMHQCVSKLFFEEEINFKRSVLRIEESFKPFYEQIKIPDINIDIKSKIPFSKKRYFKIF